jgi:uncharacterized membrane protein YkoI
MKMASILTLTVCLLFSLALTPAYAKGSAHDDRAKSSSHETAQLKVSSSAQAIQLVKRQYQGKVLKAQATKINGQPGYKVKMISKEGRVFYIFVDAQSGSVNGR